MTDDIEIAKLRDLQQHPHRHESDTIYIIPRLPSCFALLVSYMHWPWCLHMGTLAMVPPHGYTSYGAFDNKTLQGKK